MVRATNSSELERFERAGKGYLKDAMRDQGYKLKDLAIELHNHGVSITPQSLTNKINRGKYSFGFAMLVLHILNVTTVDVPERLPPR
jgi:hypothetical protein